MDKQDRTFSHQLARQLRIQDLQGRWRRVSSLSLADFEELWNETAGEIREWKGSEEFNHD